MRRLSSSTTPISISTGTTASPASARSPCNPEQPPGAKRLNEIREKIVNQQARCIFREPNFEPALVDMVVADTAAKTGVLDPEGAALTEGPELYFQLMRGIADSLKACLSPSS